MKIVRPHRYSLTSYTYYITQISVCTRLIHLDTMFAVSSNLFWNPVWFVVVVVVIIAIAIIIIIISIIIIEMMNRNHTSANSD